jgi:hypothetical protein
MCAVKCESSHKHVRNCSWIIYIFTLLSLNFFRFWTFVLSFFAYTFYRFLCTFTLRWRTTLWKVINKFLLYRTFSNGMTWKCKNVNDSPQSSKSHTYVDDSQFSGESEIEESELCCVCKKLHLKNWEKVYQKNYPLKSD